MFTLGERGGSPTRRRRDVSGEKGHLGVEGTNYRGSLVLFARYPQSSALEIPGVMRCHLAFLSSSESSKCFKHPIPVSWK